MARLPSYPEDAPVGEPAEVPAETAEEKTSGKEKDADTGRTRQIVTGAAIGIGSAALVAALLYANRSRKDGKKPGGQT